MKKTSTAIKLTICLGLCFILVYCASKGPGKVSLDPRSQQFLDYIGYIILSVEEKIFREMPPEDRGEFIRGFWARRDPDPSTPINEFRQTYYTRLATADKAFRAGKPGWKTDRGRVYILLGRPTNILRKAMGDVPYEGGKFVTASTLETGTLTEKPTEIWIYDNYPEIFSGPLRLVFVDHHGTGEYKLTTNVEITPFSMGAPTWDEPDMAKYQWQGEIEMDGRGYEALAIFDYDVTLETEKGKASSFISLSIDIPYSRVGIRQEGENYICDLIISAEVIDSQNLRVSQKGEPFSRTLSKKQLKDMIKNKVLIHKEWNFSLPPGKNLVYVSVTDSVRGKKLRKLFHAEGK
ncbi:MAG: GWxTD domain-containing protein [Candidatus Aminicenantes bacterium]|nr:GWxTD domain-containing protein [Candidatus Aminicenantes bacterium]